MLVFEPTPILSDAPTAPAASPRAHRWEQLLTGLLVGGPMIAAVWAFTRIGGHPPSALDLVLAVAMYAVTGHGVTVGFHRLFTHRSFSAARPLKVGLAVAGSMAFQGPLVGWVADHRRHHAFTDVAGDPHSPQALRTGPVAAVRGALHGHTGWLFRHDPTDPHHYAKDVVADGDLRRVSGLFPLWCVASLAVPFALGGVLGGSMATAWSALLWAGLVRIAVLHQVTWSINSICHLVGRRPHPRHDRSGDVALLSIVSMGESFHNSHHAHPRSARHGLGPHQVDSSAAVIAWCERRGWATDVRRAPAPRLSPRA